MARKGEGDEGSEREAKMSGNRRAKRDRIGPKDLGKVKGREPERPPGSVSPEESMRTTLGKAGVPLPAKRGKRK